MENYNITTLNDFIILKQKDFPYAKGELSSLLHHIGTAAKMVNKKISKAGLIDIIGSSGVGTIFSIYRRISQRGEKVINEDFLQEGSKQVAAGYIIFGSLSLRNYLHY